DVGQKGAHVGGTLRPAERHDQHGIKRHSHDGAPGHKCNDGVAMGATPSVLVRIVATLTSTRRTPMIVVRNCFIAKPGNASKLAAQLKEAAASSPLSRY